MSNVMLAPPRRTHCSPAAALRGGSTSARMVLNLDCARAGVDEVIGVSIAGGRERKPDRRQLDAASTMRNGVVGCGDLLPTVRVRAVERLAVEVGRVEEVSGGERG